MTLIEVMIAVVLLAAFIMAATGVLIQTARTSESVRLRTTAAAIAWGRVERARYMAFGEIELLVEPSPGRLIDANGLPDDQGYFRRQTAVNTTTNGLPMKRIRVEVWTRDRRTNAFSGDPESVETVITEIPRRGDDT